MYVGAYKMSGAAARTGNVKNKQMKQIKRIVDIRDC